MNVGLRLSDGGKAELLALEHVRVDAADGSLDGQLAKEKLKTNVNQKASGTTSEALYRAATKGARKLYDAKPQYGGTRLGRSGRPTPAHTPLLPLQASTSPPSETCPSSDARSSTTYPTRRSDGRWCSPRMPSSKRGIPGTLVPGLSQRWR